MNAPDGRSWWQRNWKWVVAVAAASLVALFAAGIVGVVLLIGKVTRDNDVHRTAMERVRASTEAVAALGEPIEAGWLPSGSIRVDGRTGEADLAIPVSGPRGAGSVSVIARKKGGVWYFDELELRGAGADVDLRTPEQIAAAEASR